MTRAESTWMSQSQSPARTLPSTPSPSPLRRNAGFALLQKVKSRSASSRVKAPWAQSSAAVLAPTG